MYKVSISQEKSVNTTKTVKLRKGRIGLIVSFIAFLLLDLFLIGEYQTRGVNAVGYQLMEKVNEVFESGSNIVSSIWEPELKQDNNLTGVLLVGIDTRDVEFNGVEFINKDPKPEFGTRNTDTVIELVYDHSTGKTFMISIPRDMGVDVRKDCLTFHGSLHWVYDKAQSANCPGGGQQTLVETVEGITGIKIQYYAFVSLDAFIDVIEAVGETNDKGEKGIWIDIPEPVYELYPLGDYGWESVYFPEGHQFLTAERALKFARSRKASSDFARARRQQMVITAVKDRILSSDTLMNPKKVYSLMEAFKKNTLFSEPNIEEIRAGLNLIRDIGDAEITHIVIDPDLGGIKEGLINKQPHDRNTAQYYMVPTNWKECPGNEFCRVQEYLAKVIKYPDVYKEQAKVYVYGRGYKDGSPDLDNNAYLSLKEDGIPVVLQESKYLANIENDEDIVIYDFSNGEKQRTLDALSKKLGVPITAGSDASYVCINDEDIAIVVRAD